MSDPRSAEHRSHGGRRLGLAEPTPHEREHAALVAELLAAIFSKARTT